MSYLTTILNVLNTEEIYVYKNIYKELRNFTPRSKSNKGKLIDVRTEPKIGRNQLCPCGSGKKYKFCCGNKKKNKK